MVDELSLFLPKEVETASFVIAAAVATLGAVIWLAGSWFNRTLITLVFVVSGACVGLQLPLRLGWSIDGWATAIALALLAGLIGFALHRFWVAVGLGILLAALVASVLWRARGGGPWIWPAYDQSMPATEWAERLWLSIPDSVRDSLPLAAGAMALGGFLAAMFWPRLAVVTLHSAVGAAMLVPMGIAVVRVMRPQWLADLPGTTSARAGGVAVLVVFGALLQWKLTLSRKDPKPRMGRPVVIVE